MAASVTAGVVSTFGAPVGGVMFSIEVTATYYGISNLWRSFFCAVWCVIVFNFLELLDVTGLFNDTDFENIDFNWEMIMFMLLGVITAILGSFFVYLVSKLIFIRKNAVIPILHNRFVYTLSVAMICAVCTFPS